MSQAILVLDEPLSPPRIGGIAAAIAVHVAAMMLLMAPMSYPPPVTDTEEQVLTVFETIKPLIIEVPKPPIPTTHPKPEIVQLVKTPTTITKPDIPPLVVIDGGENDTAYTPPVTDIGGPSIAPPSGPISLSTEYAPAPKYPPISLRNGEEGTVLLLVKVGADGLPIDAVIKKSSGSRELDKNALKHVLATWRFHPAIFQGIAIPALALVPVNYTISQ
jgi:periplasmic protein TonB